DLKGSTELYERVGDLVAFDLVRAHFQVLNEAVAAEAGAVVKTIGDAVMATFPTPDRAVAAALRMRKAMHALNDGRGREDLLLKIGIHEGPCLAVVLNDRQDYFGTTVNIASRVQSLADSRAILATGPVVGHPQASTLLQTNGLDPVAHQRVLRGIADEVAVYETPCPAGGGLGPLGCFRTAQNLLLPERGSGRIRPVHRKNYVDSHRATPA